MRKTAIFVTPPDLNKAKSVHEFDNLNFKKANKKLSSYFLSFWQILSYIIVFISNASLIDTVPRERNRHLYSIEFSVS